jgi:1,6-anhydro-N-acetylmuramate kinase
MPDHLLAMQFIDDFTDAVAYYGEDATRQVLRVCCAGPIARTWLTSLDDVDRQVLQCSTRDWERLIRRDFMPPKDIMEVICHGDARTWKDQEAHESE